MVRVIAVRMHLTSNYRTGIATNYDQVAGVVITRCNERINHFVDRGYLE